MNPVCRQCGRLMPGPSAGGVCPSCQLGTAADSAASTVTDPAVFSGAKGAAGAGPPERFAPGTVLADRYRIVALLGRGGMGEVYRADDMRLGQPVALKFLPRALQDDARLREMLNNEVRQARRVSHRHVCRIHDIADADGQPFLTMEFIEGDDLGALLRRIGRLPRDKALDLGCQLCEGLGAAHDEGLLHLDLKPGNLMINARGDLRIADFGLSRLASEAVEENRRAGTPAYMAPEQIRSGGGSRASDIYALGLILFEMVTGRSFHAGRSQGEIIAWQLSGNPPESPADLGADLDPGIAEVVLSCLRADPDKRPSSAAEVGERLGAMKRAASPAAPALEGGGPRSSGSGKALAALMFTDIVGSVDLQQRLGTEAYLRFVARHDQILNECFELAPDARILSETGDGFLVRFGDPSEAVKAALRIQLRLHDELVEGERLQVRIGLHLGAVTEMEESRRGERRVVGMPVNLAARVMDLAEGGQILMTRAVYEDARNYVREHPSDRDADAAPELRWTSHGFYTFKGNPEPLEIFEVGAVGVAPMTTPSDGAKAKRADTSQPGGSSARDGAGAVEAPDVLPPETISHSDVVIAYADLDDHPVATGHHGWVSQLHDNLRVRVAQLSGKNVAVVKLPDAVARDEQESAVLEHVPQAKTVVSVLSPPFIRSDRCQRIVETFWKRTEESGRFEVDRRSRLLNVVKTPVEQDEIPAGIRTLYTRLSPYEFFERDPVSGRLREFDESFGEAAVQRFHERVYDVAYDVSQVLKHFGDASGRQGGSVRTADPKTVFLAATTSDLEPQRDRLRRELVELGHEVIPTQPLPLVASDLVAVVRGCLERADVAIHLVGEHFGLVPEATELSVVALQNHVAAEFCQANPGLKRLIWMRRGLAPQDERQSAFLRRLESDPDTVTGAELIADTLENLKVLLLSRWKREREREEREKAAAAASGSGNAKPAASPTGTVPRLYIICDQQDEEAIEPLEDFFYEQGIEISLPAFEADEAETQQIHIRNLTDCDAVLVYYGAASMHWVDFKLRDLQKAVGYRDGRPIDAAAVYLAPPGNRRKERFRSVLAEVLRQEGDAFDSGVLSGFVDAIRKGKGEAR